MALVTARSNRILATSNSSGSRKSILFNLDFLHFIVTKYQFWALWRNCLRISWYPRSLDNILQLPFSCRILPAITARWTLVPICHFCLMIQSFFPINRENRMEFDLQLSPCVSRRTRWCTYRTRVEVNLPDLHSSHGLNTNNDKTDRTVSYDFQSH
jgi:hypothetical protein